MRLALKDMFTAGNLLSGMASVVLSMEYGVLYGALALFGSLFFDVTDGIVARLTHRENQFGAEFDNVSDHMSYAVAPAFLLYAAYFPVFRYDYELTKFAATACSFSIAAVPLFCGSVRFARFNTYKYDVSGCWLGFPRPASAFAFAAIANSHFFHGPPALKLIGIGMVLIFGLLNMSTFPYLNHHHESGRVPPKVWFYFGSYVVCTGLVVFLSLGLKTLSPFYIGDWMFLCMGSYAFLGWIVLPAGVRERARIAVQEAEAEVPA